MQKIFTITTIITLTTIALIYISAIKETTRINLKSSFKSFASNEPWDDYDFYIFAVQWGANYCQVSSDKDTCFKALKKNSFIHSFNSRTLAIDARWFKNKRL